MDMDTLHAIYKMPVLLIYVKRSLVDFAQIAYASVEEALRHETGEEPLAGPTYRWQVASGNGKHTDTDKRPPIDHSTGTVHSI